MDNKTEIENIEKLKSDRRVIDIIKEPLISTNLDNKDYVSRLQSYLIGNYMSIIKSIEIILTDYSSLSIAKNKFYNNILKAANYYNNLNCLWIDINDDSRIVNGISKLVALWLTSGMDSKERTKLFAEITEEIKSNNVKDTIKSIEILKNEYSLVYKFNEAYFINITKQLINPSEYKDLSLKPESEKLNDNKKSKSRFKFFGSK